MPVAERDVARGARDHDRSGGGGASRAIRARAARRRRRAKERRARARRASGRRAPQAPAPEMHWTAMGLEQKPGQRTVDSDLPEGVRRVEGHGDGDGDDADDDQNVRGATGIDGLPTDDDLPILDADDVAILLRASQLLRGAKHAVRAPVRRRGAGPVADEAVGPDRSDASNVRGGKGVPSITLAGDTSQRLFLDNGFGDWRGVLGAPRPRARRRRAAAHRLPLDARDHGGRARGDGPARRPGAARSAAQRRARRGVPLPGRRARRWRSWPRRCAISRRASRARPSRCSPATPSRPTATTKACGAPRCRRCAACAPRSSPSAPASR